jgi:hypothetical protein
VFALVRILLKNEYFATLLDTGYDAYQNPKSKRQMTILIMVMLSSPTISVGQRKTNNVLCEEFVEELILHDMQEKLIDM